MIDTILLVLAFLYGFGVVTLTINGPEQIGWGRRIVVAFLWPVWTLVAVLFWRKD